MSIKAKFSLLGAALMPFYDSSGKVLRTLVEVQQAYEAKAEQVEALEDIDDIRDDYRRLATVAIHELIATEEEAAVNYGRGDELLKKLEELDG